MDLAVAQAVDIYLAFDLAIDLDVDMDLAVAQAVDIYLAIDYSSGH